jgi:hypothetical protein
VRELSEQPLDCPYCGESISVIVDHSLGEQEYVEDCQVCCRPMVISISIDADGAASVSARYENE